MARPDPSVCSCHRVPPPLAFMKETVVQPDAGAIAVANLEDDPLRSGRALYLAGRQRPGSFRIASSNGILSLTVVSSCLLFLAIIDP